MINLFAGFDKREAIGYAVFCNSVIRHASQPVSITPLAAMGLPEGSNSFTLSRFLVPWLMGFKGHAIFCDGADMVMLGDIAELAAMADPSMAIQVVKHPDYRTRHRTKYRGTSMECPNTDYPRKNWGSVFIAQCEHPDWAWINPDSLASGDAAYFLSLRWTDAIGELPDEWNRLVDEGHPTAGAKIAHYTAGIPAFDEYANTEYSHVWHSEKRAMEIVG